MGYTGAASFNGIPGVPIHRLHPLKDGKRIAMVCFLNLVPFAARWLWRRP